MLEKIIQECPKAWSEWVDGMHRFNFRISLADKVSFTVCKRFDTLIIQADYYGQDLELDYPVRNLYDYFDGLGIYITIDTYLYDGSKKLPQREFMGWLLFDNDKYKNERIEEVSYTRIEAEWNAFYEAFKIRESQLCS